MQQNVSPGTFRPEEHLVGELDLRLHEFGVKDGTLLIFPGYQGIRLLATVENGVTSNWRAFDQQGQELDTLIFGSPSVQASPEAGPVPNLRPQYCYVCAAAGDGGYICWREPC